LSIQVYLCSSAANRFFVRSNKHLTRLGKVTVYLAFNARIDHHLRPPAIRTGESRRRTEQTADQRTFGVDLTSMLTKVRAAEIGKRCRMLRVAFDR